MKRLGQGLVLLNVAAVTVLVVACVWLSSLITEHRQKQVRDSLNGLVNSTHQAVRKWISEEQTRARAWSEFPEVIEQTQELLNAPRTLEDLATHPAQLRLREMLGNVIKASDFDGFFVIAPDYTSLASTRDSNTGTRNLLSSQPDVLQRVWEGRLAVSRPQVSDVDIAGKPGESLERRVTMFVLAPIGEPGGEVLAALAFRISLTREMVPIIANSHFGDSGYSYAFDRSGWMLSEVRFGEAGAGGAELKQKLSEDGHIAVRDPGVNLMAGGVAALPRKDQPLTRLAGLAVGGQSGALVESYRDYRGVQVVGAWVWDDELGMAIATEVETAEAYAGLLLTRWALFSLTGIAVVLGVAASVVTASQHKKVRSSEVRHRALVENLPAVTCLINPQDSGRFEFVSDQIEKLTGYGPKRFTEPCGIGYLELVHPADRGKVERGRDAAVQSGDQYSIEYRLVTADGALRWVHEHGRYIPSGFGGLPLLDLVLTDITQMRESQSLLEQYQHALDAASIVAVTDRAGTITYVNDKFCEISKYKREELLGANHRLLNSGYHPKSFFVNMYRCLAEHGIWRDEIRNRAKDGSIYWVDTTIIAFYDSDEKIDKYIAIRTDITDRMHNEQVLRETNKELESRNKEMEQFTYTVSHDLKSPLVSCIGLLNCIEADRGNENRELVSDAVRRMRSCIGRMAECIDDLLELSRIGRVRHEPRLLDMNELVNGVMDDLGTQVTQVGAEVVVEPGMPEVYADPVRVGEVIENLVVNALKYGCTGNNRRVHVGWSCVEGETRFYVKDEGGGIPVQYQPKVFGLFQRLDKSKGGTGVGLTIVKRIVEIHGGRIWIESGAGAGATFWFTLPMKKSDAAEAAEIADLRREVTD